MVKRKLTPGEIVDRLQAIEALIGEGWLIADALRLFGVSLNDFAKWRNDYAGLLRTLGPLIVNSSGPARARRPHPGRR